MEILLISAKFVQTRIAVDCWYEEGGVFVRNALLHSRLYENSVINNEIVNDFFNEGIIPDSKELSMFYILHCGDKVDYRYVYGMNVAYLIFNKKGTPQTMKE